MKKGFKFLRFAALLSVVLVMSSCNRGTGCPNNFKLGSALEGILSSLTSFLF
jgi:hypothetical protein